MDYEEAREGFIQERIVTNAMKKKKKDKVLYDKFMKAYCQPPNYTVLVGPKQYEELERLAKEYNPFKPTNEN